MLEFITSSFNNLMELFRINPIGQTIGVIAFIVSIYTFMFCKDKKFIFFTMVISIFWGAHFLALGLLSAGYIHMVDILKNALALKFEKNKYLTLGFIIIYSTISYFTFTGMISLIPLLSAIGSTILVFYVRGVYLNIGFLFIIAIWMIYNYTGGSIGGLSTDITLMISGIYGVIKILKTDKKNKNSEKIEEQVEDEVEKEIEIL